jgi:hypothetical protein
MIINTPNTLLRGLFLLGVMVLISACASSSQTIPEGDFRERTQMQEADGVRVTAGVPSARESRQIFGRSLYKKGIQPVWLKVENSRDIPVTFLPVGLDPQYFTPLEVANFGVSDKQSPESLVDTFFLNQSISLIVMPGEELSGFIFTKLDEGTKGFNVDIASVSGFNTFTFFIQVPGLNIDHYATDWQNLTRQIRLST